MLQMCLGLTLQGVCADLLSICCPVVLHVSGRFGMFKTLPGSFLS